MYVVELTCLINVLDTCIQLGIYVLKTTNL